MVLKDRLGGENKCRYDVMKYWNANCGCSFTSWVKLDLYRFLILSGIGLLLHSKFELENKTGRDGY